MAVAYLPVTGGEPCAQVGGDDWFSPLGSKAEAAAARECGPCPIKAACGQYAVLHEITEGVWGGLTPRDREAMRRRARRARS